MEIIDQLCEWYIKGWVQPQVKEGRDLADFWTKIVTGKDHKEFLIKYREKETEAQKEQLIKIYDSRTRYISNKVKSIFKKVDRTKEVIPIIDYNEKNDEDKVKEIRSKLDKFYGDHSLESWLNRNYRNLVFRDPNAFVLVIVRPYDNLKEKPSTKPVIYYSKNQIQRTYDNGVLQSATFIEPTIVKTNEHGGLIITGTGIETGTQYKTVNKYIHYVPDYAYTIREVLDTEVEKPEDYISDTSKGYYKTFSIEDKTRSFFVEEFTTQSKVVPAVQIGYIKCEDSDYDMVFDSPLHGAKDIFVEIIKKKSRYDTHLALHGYLQKYAYVPKCDYSDKNTGVRCLGGTLPTGKECPKCHGTGKMPLHTSEQDIITIELPDDRTELIDLSKLMYTDEVKIDLIQMHRDEVAELETKVSLAIFNTNMFDRKELITGTATEVMANLEHVTNELYEMAEGKARVWEFTVKQTAIYMENDEGLIVSMKNPSDFKLLSLHELFNLLEKANAAGASKESIKSIQKQIIQMQNRDNADVVLIIEAREQFRPFSDMSEAERISAITMLPADEPKRLLYFNFKEIFQEIENAESFEIEGKTVRPPFYQLPYKYQKQIVDQYLQKYIPEPSETITIRNVSEQEQQEATEVN